MSDETNPLLPLPDAVKGDADVRTGPTDEEHREATLGDDGRVIVCIHGIPFVLRGETEEERRDKRMIYGFRKNV